MASPKRAIDNRLHNAHAKALTIPVLLALSDVLTVYGNGSLAEGFRKAGIDDAANYYKWLKQEASPRIATVAELLDATGYELYVRPKQRLTK